MNIKDTLWYKTQIEPFEWFACNYCNYNFRSNKDLTEHKWIKHNIGNGKIYKCEVCSKEFKTINDISKHKIYFHRDIYVDKVKSKTCVSIDK